MHKKELEIVKNFKYLGVVYSNIRQTSLYTRHIRNIIEKAEKRINCVRHFGFDSDGLRPATSIRMYKILVRPILQYAAQVLNYKHFYFTHKRQNKINKELAHFILKLEQFQNKTLKLLIPCPKSTPPCVLRLMTGTIALSAHIDILKLRYFWKLSTAEIQSPARNIYLYERDNFQECKVSYAREMHDLCCKYGAMWVWEGTYFSHSKEKPLARIQRIVTDFHFNKDIL